MLCIWVRIDVTTVAGGTVEAMLWPRVSCRGITRHIACDAHNACDE
jgi:hypothetical protein